MKDKLLGKELAGGRFQVIGEKPLGKGGFATVYLGIQTQLKRKVAIKVLSESASEDEDLVKRFIREAKVVAMFEHPNIIKIFDSGSENGVHYFVMNYLPSTVQQLLKQPENKQGLHLNRWLKIAKDMSSALNYMHNHKTVREFIHRDIKPANIMFDESGNAILTDFGLVKSEEFSQLTLKDTVMGTPKYMSPEQVRGEELDHRADIYSLGIVLYEMLVGQPPFTGEPLSICHKQVSTPPPPLHTLKPDIPEGLEEIVMKCIEKDIKKRCQSAFEFKSDLEEWENFTRKSHLSEPTLKSAPLGDLSKTILSGEAAEQKTEYIPNRSDSAKTPKSKRTKVNVEATTSRRSKPPEKGETLVKKIQAAPTKIKWIGIAIFFLLAIAIYLLMIQQSGQIATGTLSIRSVPPGAAVFIDGQKLAEKTPLILKDYGHGKYHLLIQLEKYAIWSDSIILDANELAINPTLLALDSSSRIPEKIEAAQPVKKETVTIPGPSAGSLVIRTTPTGAKIFIDNVLQGTVTNCVINDLKPNTYKIRLLLDGYKELEDNAYVQAGKQSTMSRVLSPVPVTPPPAMGTVSIVVVKESGEPFWGRILVDGKAIPDETGEDMKAPCEIKLPVGTYRIAITKFEYIAKGGEQTIEVKPDEITLVKFTMIKTQK